MHLHLLVADASVFFVVPSWLVHAAHSELSVSHVGATVVVVDNNVFGGGESRHVLCTSCMTPPPVSSFTVSVEVTVVVEVQLVVHDVKPAKDQTSHPS
jgi:hypothetical protein